ncbi:uncharacterized protein MONBRDRAFT_32895 [Monosiga brevicollis MX1]|uniref:Uncharacterized protein n=1 Tax=Monosiga brevicollis TaxID=81824 RepID=A9V2D4_MONBE|nr:uncharacterized protein MONBRDRAFT_32895 [Monosiga brevicollis MX1]EDQ88238.1 predicted protein [Monosiga brevicollis MX1]|eukprot:XP_001746831.1 hypothetical protein [Monosiga brevicollis MX1]
MASGGEGVVGVGVQALQGRELGSDRASGMSGSERGVESDEDSLPPFQRDERDEEAAHSAWYLGGREDVESASEDESSELLSAQEVQPVDGQPREPQPAKRSRRQLRRDAYNYNSILAAEASAHRSAPSVIMETYALPLAVSAWNDPSAAPPGALSKVDLAADLDVGESRLPNEEGFAKSVQPFTAFERVSPYLFSTAAETVAPDHVRTRGPFPLLEDALRLEIYRQWPTLREQLQAHDHDGFVGETLPESLVSKLALRLADRLTCLKLPYPLPLSSAPLAYRVDLGSGCELNTARSPDSNRGLTFGLVQTATGIMAKPAGELPDFDKMKHKTMMRMGELTAMDEEQRKLIMEMVKQGSLTVEDAVDEVKRIKPKTVGCKFLGSCPSLVEGTGVTAQNAEALISNALEYFKQNKIVTVKASAMISTIGLRIADPAEDGLVYENESMPMIQHFCISGGKTLAVFAVHHKLGLVYTYLLQFGKAREAADALELLQDRQALSRETKVLGGVAEENEEDEEGDEGADVDDDDDDDDDDEQPFWLSHVYYVGTINAADHSGQNTVEHAMGLLADQVRGKPTKFKDLAATDGHRVCLVFSAEGVRVVDAATKELLFNTLVKAVSFHCTTKLKKGDAFAYIEVDDRRSDNECHVFVCQRSPKNQADQLTEAMNKTVQIGKDRVGNPFRALGKKREAVSSSALAAIQLPRKSLKAVKAIGAGQFGKVYLSEYSVDGAEVEGEPELRAVKMLRGQASDNDRDEFLREAETMLQIGAHENLVSLCGVVLNKRPMLMVLEYCQYGDLSDVLRSLRRKNIKLNLGEQLHMANQLASGMQYIASKHFVHMDLAARNCLLGPNSSIRIADFGLTRPHDNQKNYYKQQGVMKLSIRWLAIDAFQYKIFSEKSDVWSFAVTVWEILAYGRQPYHGTELKQVMKAVIAGRRLSQPKECPDDVWDMLYSCWIKEPNRRPTFRQLKKAVDFLMAEHKIELSAIRDVGALLNADLTENIKMLTLQRRKSSRADAGARKASAAPSAMGALAE